MITLNNYNILFLGFAYFGVGYTLLRYSADGDLTLQKKTHVSVKSEDEAWDRLNDLAGAAATDVNWNTSLFVALSASLILLGIFKQTDFHNKSHVISCWIISVLVIFGLQDIVVRWKQAHRKHAISKEQLNLISHLRWRKQV